MNESMISNCSAGSRAATGSLRRNLMSTVAASACLACAAPAGVGAQAQTLPLTGVLATVEGDVQGVVTNGVSEFLGIPYAAPPTGEMRWRPPQGVPHWTQTLA